MLHVLCPMKEWKVFLLLNSLILTINDYMYLKFLLILALIFTNLPFAHAQDNPPNVSTSPAVSKPADMVMVETNVAQIILNDEHRSGVDWAAIVSDFHTTSLKKEEDPMWTDEKYR